MLSPQTKRVAAAVLLAALCVSTPPDARAQDGAGERAGAGGRARAAPGPRRRRTPPKVARAASETKEADARARALLEEGHRRADEGRLDEALQAYGQALAIEPRYGDAYVGMGDAYMSAGRYKEAFAAYERAIGVAPRNPDAYYGLGAAYNDMGQYGDAFKPLTQAIQLDPGFAEAHYGIGYAYLRLENFKDALGYLRQAVRLMPDHAEAHLALGQTHLGLGRVKAAEEELKILSGLDATAARVLEKNIREAATETRDAAMNERAAPTPRTKPTPQPSPAGPRGGEAAATPPRRPAAAPAPARTENGAFELTFWESIKDSAEPEEFAAYIRKYPDGQFVELARIRMRALESKRSAAKETEAASMSAPEMPRAADAAADAARPQPSPPAPVAAEPSAAERPAKPSAEEAAQAAAAQPSEVAVAKEKAQPAEETKAAAGEADETAMTVEEATNLLRKLFPSKFTYRAETAGGPGAAPASSAVSVNYEPLEFDGCQLSWRDSNDTLSVSLSDLDAEAVTVAPRVRPSTTFSAEVWDVTVATQGGRGAISEEKGDGSGAVNVYNGLDLQYDSRQKAERVARALRQAIRLCAGKT